MTDRYATILPTPRMAARTNGSLELGPDTVLTAAPGAEPAADLVRLLLTRLRLPLRPVGSASHDATTLTVRLDPNGTEPILSEPEGYRLSVTSEGVTITARDLDGVRHATHVLLQLLPDEAWRSTTIPGTRWLLDCGEVTDAPALPWRGGMLDVTRHFLPKRGVLRAIDLLAMHRFNRLHLHLTDDQGWRIESRRYPELTEVAAHRDHTLSGFIARASDGDNDGTPHGGYYTQRDLAEIAAYGAERGITIVPEIDLPGHSSALLAARPELGIGTHTVMAGGGISSGVLNPLPDTVRFIGSVLEELLESLPTPYVHMGGDECVLEGWPTDPRVAAEMKRLGFDKPTQMHGHFLRELGALVAGHGKRMVVWDEAFVTGGVLEDTIVMAWRGDAVARKAAAAGHDTLRCPVYPTYFDYRQADGADEPISIGGPITLADTAGLDPRPDDWSDAERARVIGAQFQLWAEFVPNERHLDYMVYPRACALAEVAWTGAPADLDAFTRRLDGHLPRLDAAGVEYRPLDGPHPWQRGGTGIRRARPGLPIELIREHLEKASESGEAPKIDPDEIARFLAGDADSSLG